MSLSLCVVPFEGDVSVRLRALHEVQGERLDHVYVIDATDPLLPRPHA